MPVESKQWGALFFLRSLAGLFDSWISTLKLYLTIRKLRCKSAKRLSSILLGLSILWHADTLKNTQSCTPYVLRREREIVLKAVYAKLSTESQGSFKNYLLHVFDFFSRTARPCEIFKCYALLTGFSFPTTEISSSYAFRTVSNCLP